MKDIHSTTYCYKMKLINIYKINRFNAQLNSPKNKYINFDVLFFLKSFLKPIYPRGLLKLYFKSLINCLFKSPSLCGDKRMNNSELAAMYLTFESRRES